MIKNNLFLDVLNGQSTERPPVWFMRQAGRYLPDYMKLKEKYSFFERVQQPELATAITVMPVDQLDVDAAILFSDILVIAQALGKEVQMHEGKGPLIPETVRSMRDIDMNCAEEILSYVPATLKAVKEGLSNRVPLIGFCGSPWTLLCYMVEGKGSKDFSLAKQFIVQNPKVAADLLDAITKVSIQYLKMQVAAGVNAIQVFDSWGGLLSPELYRQFSLPYLQQITDAIQAEVPVILFGKGCWFALHELSHTRASALGLDWTIRPGFAREMCKSGTVFQGNLDPAILLADPDTVRTATIKMIDEFGPGQHIVNLGHGVLPGTKPESAKAFVDAAKNYRYAHQRAI